MARRKTAGAKRSAKNRALKRRVPKSSKKPKLTTRPGECPWFLYVAECADRTLYVGIAKSVEARLACHNSGRGAKYTRTRGPVRLVYSERLADVGAALRREREVKRWSRPQKVAELALASPPRLSPKRARSVARAAG